MSDPRTVPLPSLLISRKRRGDLIALLVVLLLFVFVLFTLLPIWSGGVAAISNLPVDLHAKVTADYSKDPLGTTHPAVGLGIIESVLLDENPFASDIDERIATLTEGISMPVPTSTQMRPTNTQEPAGLSTTVATSSAPAAGTIGPVSTNTPTAPVLSTWTITPSLTATAAGTSVPPSTPGGTITITPTPTRTVTLPPGVTATPSATATATATQSQVLCESYPSSGLVAVQDTWVDESKPDSSNATAPKLQVQAGVGQQMQALIQFDLTGIPEGSVVESATLYLNVTKTSSYLVEFREIFSEWSESVTWHTQPDYDFSFVSGELQLSPNQPGNCVRAVALDTELIEYWVDNPDLNYGLTLMASDVGERTDYSSQESNRPPRLIITYTQ